MRFQGTLAGHGNGVATGWLLFEALLSSLDDFVERSDIDLPILLAQVSVDHRVELPQDLAQLGVEVVLDAVVASTWGQQYLPGIWEAMRDHLFPI